MIRAFKVLSSASRFLFKQCRTTGSSAAGSSSTPRTYGAAGLGLSRSGNGVPDLATLVHKVTDYREGPVSPDPRSAASSSTTSPSSPATPARPGRPHSPERRLRQSYELPTDDTEVGAAFRLLSLAADNEAPAVDITYPEPAVREMFGNARLVRPRLGQGGFRASVLDAYDRRCAVTGHKITPTLQKLPTFGQ